MRVSWTKQIEETNQLVVPRTLSQTRWRKRAFLKTASAPGDFDGKSGFSVAKMETEIRNLPQGNRSIVLKNYVQRARLQMCFLLHNYV